MIYADLVFIGTKGERQHKTLFSPGANLSCISPHLANALADLQSLPDARAITTAFEARIFTVTYRITLDFYIADVLLSDEFLVVPGLSEEAIIGAATMQKWRIKLNFDDDRVEVDPEVAKMQLI